MLCLHWTLLSENDSGKARIIELILNLTLSTINSHYYKKNYFQTK